MITIEQNQMYEHSINSKCKILELKNRGKKKKTRMNVNDDCSLLKSISCHIQGFYL